MRQFITAWEFWVPPTLAFVAIGSMVWLSNHNQDITRQHQIDAAALMQTRHVDEKIEELREQVQKLRTDFETNKAAIEEVTP